MTDAEHAAVLTDLDTTKGAQFTLPQRSAIERAIELLEREDVLDALDMRHGEGWRDQ